MPNMVTLPWRGVVDRERPIRPGPNRRLYPRRNGDARGYPTNPAGGHDPADPALGADGYVTVAAARMTGARWRDDHVGQLVELGPLVDTPDWPAFWSTAGPPPKSKRAPPPHCL